MDSMWALDIVKSKKSHGIALIFFVTEYIYLLNRAGHTYKFYYTKREKAIIDRKQYTIFK